jgi:hypothetical protein
MENINTGLRVGQAIDQNNPFGAVTALAGNADAQSLLGLGNVNIGGFTAKDVMAAGSLAQAASSNNTAGVLTSLGTLAGSSDTVLAGRALSLFNRIQNGDVKALGEAMSLSNSVAGGGSTSTTGTTGSTTVGNFDDTEVTRLRGLGYTNAQIQEYFSNLDNLTELLDTPASTVVGATGNDVTLPTGVQLASTGDGVFRTDVGGVPTYAESSNASSVKAPLGYTLLSMLESDEKPAGSYYDITANAWFKPDTAVTNLTGDATIQADAALFNSSLGTLDQLDPNRTSDDFANFLRTIGITNVTQLTDSGLSNQDILDMINALDDTVTVTGATGNDTITGATGNGTITGGTGNDNLETVTVTGAKGNDTITGGGGNDNVPTVTIVDKKCPPGFVYDEDLKQCVPVTEQPITCPPGFHLGPDGKTCVADESKLVCSKGFELNEAGTACIPVVEVKDCPEGQHRDETGKCVPDTIECGAGYHLEDGACVKDALVCSEGFQLNEAGTECIPVVKVDECKTGFHRDETGVCVPDEIKCSAGYHLENGVCVADKLVCSKGFELNEAGTECIPIIEIKACPTGQHRDETGKCVPDTEECAEGFHLEDGLCVPDDDEKCKDGYEKVNGVCEPVCKEGYIRNLATGVCETEEKACPVGQVKDASGKCVPIKKTEECKPGFEKVNGVCVPICQPGYVRINGVCKKIPTEVIPMQVSGPVESGEKTDPIYAGGMDSFNLLATLQELLAEEAPKKDDKKSKDKTKMATGGHLDDLLAEQMTVDDLLKLLR